MSKISTILLFTLYSSTALAADKMTFNEAIDLAVQNNLEVKASYDEWKASQADKKSVRSAYFPKISASLDYDKTNIDSKTTGNSITTSGYTKALNLSYNLFNGFSDYANLKIAEANIRTNEADLQETKAKISFDLKTAVANFNFAKESLVQMREILKRREDNLRTVELRFDNGRENKGSVLLSRAYLEQAKLDVLRAENGLESSRVFLNRVLNLSESSSVDVEAPVVSTVTAPNFDFLIPNTPTAKKFKATLDNATATLQSKESGYYPKWDVSGSTGKKGNELFPNVESNWRIGTSLTWEIFSGGKDFYSANSAALIEKSAEKRLENQNKELRRNLVENYITFTEAFQEVKVSSAFLEAAKVRAEISRSKYNNGLMTFDDWDIIENDLISRQKDYTLKIRDRLTAEAAWEQVQGTGVIP
jgi:outer membrane protein